MEDNNIAAVEEIELPSADDEAPKVRRGRKPKAGSEAEIAEAFPVKLLRNYMPIGRYKITDKNAENAIDPPFAVLGREPAGAFLLLPLEEARRAIANGIAERNDPID